MTTLIGLGKSLAAALYTFIFALAVMVVIPFDRKRGTKYHFFSRVWSHGLLRIAGVRVRVSGLEKLTPARNYVYVSNHASVFDIPAVIAGIPDQIRIVYKKELEIIPVFGWGLKWGNYIGIDRQNRVGAMKSLEDAANKIRGGASVLLYAEGTRTKTGKMQPFKRGAFNLALKSGIPVVPLTINGSFNLLPRRSLVIRPGTVDLVLGEPIPVDGLSGREAELRLMERVHEAIARHYRDQEVLGMGREKQEA